ncbi:hypothetical protein [uncultured Jannaschia sp.]|uniref:hypothetical protein n=1 Tax=uncultured Jannaschia sp. TaxID=293347 RepID=UPI002631F9CB|nr:hypothetical protein [uncultured Jannaschia sp.]
MTPSDTDKPSGILASDGRAADPDAIRVVATAMRRIAEAWSLTPDEAAGLLDVAPDDWDRIAAGTYDAPFEAGQLKRAGLLVALYSAQRAAFGGRLGPTWIMRPNTGPDYDGRRPVDRMLDDGSAGMMFVYRHLRSIQQPW